MLSEIIITPYSNGVDEYTTTYTEHKNITEWSYYRLSCIMLLLTALVELHTEMRGREGNEGERGNLTNKFMCIYIKWDPSNQEINEDTSIQATLKPLKSGHHTNQDSFFCPNKAPLCPVTYLLLLGTIATCPAKREG